MMIKELAGLPKKQLEEKITNRVLVNFGYTVLGYVLLYVFYLYAMGRIGSILSYRYVMLGIFLACAIAAIVLYVLSFMKQPKFEKHRARLRNYGHFALGVAIAVFYLNLPFYTQWLPTEAAPAYLRSFILFLKNTKMEYYVVAVLMLVYLVATIVYHNVLLHKLTKRAKSKAKNK